MTIRKAEEKDLPMVKQLLGQVLEIHAALRPDLFIPGTRKYTDAELLAIFNTETTPVFVAADATDTVRGYCFCVLQERTGSNNMHDMKTLYIDDLCVDETARGMHIGAALYDFVLEFAKQNGCHNVTLHVWEGNDGARAFYEKMGFGVQKTLMEKRLS